MIRNRRCFSFSSTVSLRTITSLLLRSAERAGNVFQSGGVWQKDPGTTLKDGFNPERAGKSLKYRTYTHEQY